MNRAFAAVFVLSCAACAGKSNTTPAAADTTGGSSSGGTGGASGSGNSGDAGLGASAGASSSACPSVPPLAGSACNYLGAQCNYTPDACTSLAFSCTRGVWTDVPHSDGAAFTCANFTGPNLPLNGASCACLGLLDCSIDDCAATGKVHAACDNTLWHVTTEPCTGTPCGPSGLNCQVGEACVMIESLPATYTCQPDPCAAQSESTACSCAASLCGSTPSLCVVLNGVLSCSCPNC